MNPIQWVLWKQNRRRRAVTFRAALSGIENHTHAFLWWWDRAAALEVEELRVGNKEEAAYYRGQRRLMEWLIHGLKESERPNHPAQGSGDRPDHPGG